MSTPPPLQRAISMMTRSSLNLVPLTACSLNDDPIFHCTWYMFCSFPAKPLTPLLFTLGNLKFEKRLSQYKFPALHNISIWTMHFFRLLFPYTVLISVSAISPNHIPSKPRSFKIHAFSSAKPKLVRRGRGSISATPQPQPESQYTWIAPVSVGTPPQVLNVTLDTGSGDLSAHPKHVRLVLEMPTT